MENDQDDIILSIDTSKTLSQLPDNQVCKVDLTLQLYNFQETTTTNPNVKWYQGIYKDRTTRIKNFLLQDFSKEDLEPGDIHHIKAIKPFLVNATLTIYAIKKDAVDVICSREIEREPEQINKTAIQKPSPKMSHIARPKPNVRPDLHLLSHLTTFSQDITVMVKILNKTQLRTYTNKTTGQPGMVLGFSMIDVEGYEMGASVFGAAAEKFDGILENGKSYLIKGGNIKLNDQKYSTSRSMYRIFFDERTQINPLNEEVKFSETQLHLVPIEDLPNIAISFCIDCYVYVIEGGDKRVITSKTGTDLSMRRITVGDSSGYQCHLTLWRHFSEMDIQEKQVLLLQYARVGEFNGRNLNTSDATNIKINPDDEEAQKLHEFASNYTDWKVLKSSTIFECALPTETTFLKDVIDKIPLYPDNKSPIYRIKAVVCPLHHSESNYYLGCPDKNCKKKLNIESNGGYSCPGCGKNCEKPLVYFTLQIRIKDCSTDTYVGMFNETGSKLLGITAEEYKDLIDKNDEVKQKEISAKVDFTTRIFIVKGRLDSYNGQEKRKVNVIRVENVDMVKEARDIVNKLKALKSN